MDLASMLLILCLFFTLFLNVANAQTDVECLKEFKNSVQTSGEYLQSWDFGTIKSGNNATSAAPPPNICNFIGVQCLHPSEIKVYSLSLPGAGLRGTFPKGLEKCTSLTGLDLSSNALTGPIPGNICQMLPYLVKLDLSQNNISGNIPEGLASCVYLNELRLQHNTLFGVIPGQIGLLSRLRDFNVASNRLTGAIPYSFTAVRPGGQRPAAFPAADFDGNDGLCGPPLRKACPPGTSGGGPGSERRRRARAGAAVIAGVAVGGAVALLAAASVCIWIMLDRLRVASGKGAAGGGSDDNSDMLDNAWIRRLVPAGIVVSMFEQPLVKIRLVDLAAATAGFARESVMGYSRTGVFYKATLRDGSVLAIKRLPRSMLSHNGSEKHFRGEMEALSRVRHRNLVPLLGYCIAGPERLLVYKHMTGGPLRERLESGTDLDWTTRLRIAVGAARGLAWLHHSCSPRLVHRCITSTSVLLDEDLEPRIGDFGLARLMNMNTTRTMVTAPSTAVTTPSGTSTTLTGGDARLYVAPEEISFSSATAPSATTKGDVYSFGVVLLELVTGRRPSDGGEGGRSLVEWIGDLFKTGHVSEAIDRRLVAAEAAALAAAAAAADGCMSDNSSSGSGKRREVMQVLKIACSCVLSFPKERPSMYEVYHMLRGVGEDYYPAATAAPVVRRHPHIRQIEDEGDIAAASAALARNGDDHQVQQQQQEQQQQQQRDVQEQQQVQEQQNPAASAPGNGEGLQMQRFDA